MRCGGCCAGARDSLNAISADDSASPTLYASSGRLNRAFRNACGQVGTEVSYSYLEVSAYVSGQTRRWGSGGRGFKSPLPDQNNYPSHNNLSNPPIGEKRPRGGRVSSAVSSSPPLDAGAPAPTHSDSPPPPPATMDAEGRHARRTHFPGGMATRLQVRPATIAKWTRLGWFPEPTAWISDRVIL